MGAGKGWGGGRGQPQGIFNPWDWNKLSQMVGALPQQPCGAETLNED